MKKESHNESCNDAVSPVVGVMLMIVVVVLVAGAVTLFATGFTGDIHTTPVAKLSYLGVVQGDDFDSGYVGEIGFVFQHVGGDNLNLQDISLSLAEKSNVLSDEVTLSFYDVPKNADGKEPGVAKFSASGVKSRFKKAGVTATTATQPKNLYISAGDKFVVYVDKIVQTQGSRYNTVGISVYRDDLLYAEGDFKLSKSTEYSFKDIKTGNVISSGNLEGTSYVSI